MLSENYKLRKRWNDILRNAKRRKRRTSLKDGNKMKEEKNIVLDPVEK